MYIVHDTADFIKQTRFQLDIPTHAKICLNLLGLIFSLGSNKFLKKDTYVFLSILPNFINTLANFPII